MESISSRYARHEFIPDGGSLKRSYQEMIESLREEVNVMEKKLATNTTAVKKNVDSDKASAKKILNYLLNGGTESMNDYLKPDEEVEPVDDSKLRQDETQIQSLAQLTGIIIEKASSYLVPVDRNVILRRYTILGESYRLPFKLVFDVDEPRLQIVSAKAEVPLDLHFELKPLLSSVEEDRSVRPFFRNFVRFAELHEKRASVFAYCKNRYPQNISLPHGKFSSMLYFSPGGNSSFCFQVRWQLTFSREGCLSQNIQLLPRISNEENDASGESAHIRQKFLDLVQMKGLQAAIEIFILLGLSKHPMAGET